MSTERVKGIIEELSSLTPDEIFMLAEMVRDSSDDRVKSFRILVSNPWMASRCAAIFFQLMWVIVASLSLIGGIYLLTPVYSFAGTNATELLKSFLTAVADNPGLLRITDPIMRLLGFAMIVVAVVGFYQAHMVRQVYEEFWGGGGEG